MMQFLRRYGGPVFAAAAVLLLVWMVWELSGLSDTSSQGSRVRSVGSVNGQPVDLRTYQLEVQQEIDQRQRQGGTLSGDQVKQVQDEVWNRSIQERLLQAQYRRLGLTASAEEIAGLMKSSPLPELTRMEEFQTDKKFDLAKYQRWLQSTSAQPFIPQLEQQYRDQILQGKLFEAITADIYVSDALLWQFYRDSKEKATIDLATILPANAVPDTAVHLSNDAIAAYYRDHQEEFRRPRIAYLSYVSLPRLPNASDSAAALERARSLRKEILGGAPFAEVARRESADSASAIKGGDLGEWQRGSFDPAFEAAAFSLPLHTVSEPVLTPFGYHLIEITSRKGNTASGSHILVPFEVTGAHRDQIDAEADTLEELGAEKLDPTALDTVARALRLHIGHANPLREGDGVQIGLQPVPDAGNWAFEAKKGETSRVIEVSYALFLFRLDSLLPAGIPPLAEIRPAVEEKARLHAKWPQARDVAKALQARAKDSKSLAQAAKALGVPEQRLGPFSRLDAPLPEGVLVGTAFALDSGEVSRVLETSQALYVLQGQGRVRADSAEFLKQAAEMRAQLTRQLRQQRVRNFMEALRASAKIVDNRAQVFRTGAQADAAIPPRS
jgi:peptidyl-prolyl cis-trans isomerase D